MLTESHVEDYFNNTCYHGELIDNSIVAQAGLVEQGLVMCFYLQLQRDKIINARFKVYGDHFCIATGHWFCDKIINKSIHDINYNCDDLLAMLQVPGQKLIAVTLAEVIKLALSQHKDSQESYSVSS